MTIETAITRVNDLKPNSYTEDTKKTWLSQVDWQVKKEVIDRSINKIEYNGYGEDTDRTTELLVEQPYDELYIHYLKAQIDYENGEIDKYKNNMDLYNSIFYEYSKYYRRNNRSNGVKKFTYYGG